MKRSSLLLLVPMLATAWHLSQRPNDYLGETLSEPPYLYPLLAWLLLTGLVGLLYNLQSVRGKATHFLAKSPWMMVGLGVGLLVGLILLPRFTPIRNLIYYLNPYLWVVGFTFWGILTYDVVQTQPPWAQTFRQGLTRTGLISLMILLTLEILLRLFPLPANNPVRIQKDLAYLFQGEPAFGWSLRPNHEFIWAQEGEFENPVQLNDLGQHDLERQYERAAGVRRILVIGDSFVEALQVPLPQTPTQVAEACLNETSNQQIEVLNGGISATGTGQQLRFWNYSAYRYQPDEVVLAVYLLNDLNDNEPTRNWIISLYGTYGFGVAADGTVQADYIEPWRSWLDWGADALHLESLRTWRAIQRLQTRQQPVILQIPRFILASFQDDLGGQIWQLLLALVRDFKTSVEARGAKFSVMLIPSQAELFPDQIFDPAPDLELAPFGTYEATLATFAAEGIPVIDLYAPVRAEATPEALFFPHDGHFNTVGYKLMGETLCQALSDEDD